MFYSFPLSMCSCGNPQKAFLSILHFRSSQGVWRRRQWEPTPVFLPGESDGQRSLVGCGPQGSKRSDSTEMTQCAQGVWDGHVPSAIFKMDNQQWLTVDHLQLCSMLCGSLDGRGIGEEWIHVYLWLSPFTVHLKLLQHCLLINYTPVQNKKFNNVKN